MPLDKQRVEALKREAFATKKATGKPQHEVLREIAQREGFVNWETLIRVASRPQELSS